MHKERTLFAPLRAQKKGVIKWVCHTHQSGPREVPRQAARRRRLIRWRRSRLPAWPPGGAGCPRRRGAAPGRAPCSPPPAPAQMCGAVGKLRDPWHGKMPCRRRALTLKGAGQPSGSASRSLSTTCRQCARAMIAHNLSVPEAWPRYGQHTQALRQGPAPAPHLGVNDLGQTAARPGVLGAVHLQDRGAQHQRCVQHTNTALLLRIPTCPSPATGWAHPCRALTSHRRMANAYTAWSGAQR